jgi:hypothetical protein
VVSKRAPKRISFGRGQTPSVRPYPRASPVSGGLFQRRSNSLPNFRYPLVVLDRVCPCKGGGRAAARAPRSIPKRSSDSGRPLDPSRSRGSAGAARRQQNRGSSRATAPPSPARHPGTPDGRRRRVVSQAPWSMRDCPWWP